MTFLELLNLVNESDENKPKLTEDEYAALLNANSEVKSADNLPSDEDIDEDEDEIDSDEKDLQKVNQEVVKAEENRAKLADTVKQLHADIYNVIVSNREKNNVSVNIPLENLPVIGSVPALSRNVIRQLNLPVTENGKLLNKFEEFRQQKKELERANAHLQIIQKNAEEDQRRSQLSSTAAKYREEIGDLERYVKPRGLQSKEQVITPLSKGPETYKSLVADLKRIEAEKRQELENEADELKLGIEKKPFAPDPKGVQTSQIFNQGVSFKRMTPGQWSYDSNRYIYDPKKGKFRPVPPAKSSNVPKKVGEVFYALVATDSAYHQQYIDQLDEAFTGYKKMYDEVTANVNTIKIARDRIEALENRLDIAKNVMLENTASRVHEADAQLKLLPSRLTAALEDYELKKRSGATDDVLTNIERDIKRIEQEIEEYNNMGPFKKGPQMKGKARSLYDEEKRLNNLLQKVNKEKNDAIKEYNVQKSGTSALREKMKDPSKTENELELIDSLLKDQGEKEIAHYNTYRVKLEEYKKLRDTVLKVRKRISNYENELRRRSFTIVGKENEGKKKPDLEEPTVYNSRTATSIAFEYQRQKKLMKTFEGLVKSIRYGKVNRVELNEDEVDLVMTRDGKTVFPDKNLDGTINYLRVISYDRPGFDKKFYKLTTSVKGLYGYGGRPGFDEEGYKGPVIDGLFNNEGYYQSQEKCYETIERLSTEMDSRRDKIVENVYNILNNAVGHKFSMGVAAGAKNIGMDAVKAWVGLKKAQRAEYKKEEYDLRGYTTDPVMSLYAFFINAQQKKMRKEKFKSNRRTDAEAQLRLAASSMPATTIPNDYAIKSPQNGRRHAAFIDARNRSLAVPKETGDERYNVPINDYYNDRKITKQEYFDAINKIANSEPPAPENIVPFTSVTTELIDEEDFDVDTKIADSKPAVSTQEQVRIQAEDEDYENQMTNLLELTSKPVSISQSEIGSQDDDSDIIDGPEEG